LVEELYGEIRNFSLYPWNQNVVMRFQVLDSEVMFLWYVKKKEGDLKEFWHFGHVSENSKYASEYPENVTVNEYLNSMQLVKKYLKCLKNWCLCFKSISITFG
jgi:uncharacterized protein YlbG (UPF0298 family)